MPSSSGEEGMDRKNYKAEGTQDKLPHPNFESVIAKALPALVITLPHLNSPKSLMCCGGKDSDKARLLQPAPRPGTHLPQGSTGWKKTLSPFENNCCYFPLYKYIQLVHWVSTPPPPPLPLSHFLLYHRKEEEGFRECGCLPNGVSKPSPHAPASPLRSWPYGAVSSPYTGFTSASENEKLY